MQTYNISAPIYSKPDGSYLLTKDGKLYHLLQQDPDKPEGLWEETMAFIARNPDSVKPLRQDENPPEIQQILDEMSANDGATIPEPEINWFGFTQSEINTFMVAMMNGMGIAQAKKDGQQVEDAIRKIDFSKALGEL